MPIHVTLDEHTARLRPEVEAELFRIAQEAMNNAVKHSQATTIEVHCQVHAPEAVISVTDDGRGLQQAAPHLARPGDHARAGPAHQRRPRPGRAARVAASPSPCGFPATSCPQIAPETPVARARIGA